MILFYLLFYAFMVFIATMVLGGHTPTSKLLPREAFDETLKRMNSDSRNHILVCIIIIISALVPIIDSFLETVTVRSDTERGKYEQVSRLLQLDLSSGWGIFFLVVSYALIVCMLIWIISNLNYRTKNRQFLEKLVDNYDKNQIVLAEHRAKEEEKNQNALSALSAELGDPTRIIKPLNNTIKKAFIVFSKTQKIYYDTQVIPYKQIIGCEIKDDSHTTIEGEKTAITTSSTGSTIGRSVVGGLVAGPAGAIIGGSTAKKETQIIDNTQTIIHHHYYALISTTDPTNPIVSIDCGTNSSKIAEEIKAIVEGIVVESSRSEVRSTSVTDELLKLADLKERGILSDAEFEQQKKRILESNN